MQHTNTPAARAGHQSPVKARILPPFLYTALLLSHTFLTPFPFFCHRLACAEVLSKPRPPLPSAAHAAAQVAAPQQQQHPAASMAEWLLLALSAPPGFWMVVSGPAAPGPAAAGGAPAATSGDAGQRVAVAVAAGLAQGGAFGMLQNLLLVCSPLAPAGGGGPTYAETLCTQVWNLGVWVMMLVLVGG